MDVHRTGMGRGGHILTQSAQARRAVESEPHHEGEGQKGSASGIMQPPDMEGILQ